MYSSAKLFYMDAIFTLLVAALLVFLYFQPQYFEDSNVRLMVLIGGAILPLKYLRLVFKQGVADANNKSS